MRRCKVDNACLKSGRCLRGIVSEPTKFERIHQLLRYTLSSSSVAMWVWSSFANLSISRITSSLRHNCSMVFRNHVSRMNAQELSFPALLLELICSVVFSITFFLSVPVTVWSALPYVKARDREEIKNGLDVLLVLCRIISQRSARTCSRRCQRPNTPGMLCIVL